MKTIQLLFKRTVLVAVALLTTALCLQAFTLDAGKILGAFRLWVQPTPGYVHTNIVQIYDAGTNSGLQILTNTTATVIVRYGGVNHTAFSGLRYFTNVGGVVTSNLFLNGFQIQ